MKLMQVTENIPTWYQMSVQPKGLSIYLVGPSGRGKTTAIEEAPILLETANPGKKFGFVCINGAAFTLTSATGYLWPTEEEGKQYSRFTRPDWWITSEGKRLEDYDGGVILVDEADKLGADEKKIMGEGALSKRLASHQLPPGWVVWFAGNTSKDRSGSTKEFDHLINRRMEIKVDDDLDSLVHFMERKGCLPETILFAQENPNIVFPENVPEKQGPWCTPRSLVATDQFLQLLMQVNNLDTIPTTADVTEQMAGAIGAGAAAQYMATVRLGQELPSYEEIVAKPTTIAVPSRPDAQMLAIYKLAAKVNKKEIGAVLSYVKRLPKEFAINFARATTKRDMSFINTQAFREWCAENASLVNVLNSLPVK